MIKPVTLEIELNDKDYKVEVEIRYSVDKNYGADADGRRGIEKAIYEGFEIIEVDRDREYIDAFPELVDAVENKIANEFLELIND